MIENFKDYWKVLALLGVALAGFAYTAWWAVQPKVDTTVAVESKPAAAIKQVRRVTTHVKSVQTYAPEAKANLKLPPAVIADVTKQVTAATTVQASERPVTVSTVLDTVTGESKTYTKPEPYPLFAVESRGEVRFDYGYKLDRNMLVPRPVGRLTVIQEVAQVKGVHLGGSASIDTDGTAFVGIGASYRW